MWREIKGVTGYEVSTDGQIRSMNYRNKAGVVKILRLGKSATGTQLARLGSQRVSLAFLVLSTFDKPRPSPEHRPFHKNGDNSDDRLENLEWMHLSAINRHCVQKAIANGNYTAGFKVGHKLNEKKKI